MANEFEEDEFGGVEDEDLLLAAMHVEKTSAPSTNDGSNALSPITSSSPYRLEFGKHRDKTLDEVPQSYIHWIVSGNIYDKYPDLKAALLARGSIMDRDDSSMASKKSSKEDPGEQHISQVTSESGIYSYYRLNFGKYCGKTLKEVPESYIRFLAESRIYESRPDLRGALTELARLRNPSSERKVSERKAPEDFVRSHLDPVFSDPWSGEAIWITSRDASKFFHVTDSDFQFSGVMSLGKGRWMLYDVYRYVQRHSSRRIANQGLKQFLQKNNHREHEIYQDLGLGHCNAHLYNDCEAGDFVWTERG